jgi:hypothetical protein
MDKNNQQNISASEQLASNPQTEFGAKNARDPKFSKIRYGVGWVRTYAFFILIGIVILFVLTSPIGTWLVSNSLEHMNPAYAQRQAIQEFNNVDDAFSGIQGTKIEEVPINGAAKLFSWTSRSDHEIKISIPKFIGTSEIFDDNQQLDRLLIKTLIKSVNSDLLLEQSKGYTVMYNGAEIASAKDNLIVPDEESSYGDITKVDKDEVNKLIPNVVSNYSEYEFAKWIKNNGNENVTYKYSDDNQQEISVEGQARMKGLLGITDITKKYKVAIIFEKVDNAFIYKDGTLNVEEVE